MYGVYFYDVKLLLNVVMKGEKNLQNKEDDRLIFIKNKINRNADPPI